MDPTPASAAQAHADTHRDARSRRRRVLLFAAVVVATLWTFPYQRRINNPNENVRLYMTAAIVEDGTYAIDGPWKRWGWVNDAAIKDGHHYSVKAPATSLLGVPAYAGYRALCAATGHAFDRAEALWAVRVFASLLPYWALLWIWLPWLHRHSKSPLLAEATWLGVALGSLLYGYALLFVSHTLAAVAAMGALMLLERAGRPGGLSRAGVALAGLLSATVTAAEYPGVIASLCLSALALVVVRPWPRLLAFAAGAALPTLAVMHFQWRAFGSPWTPGHLYLENASFRAIHHQGVFGADAFRPDAAAALLFDPGFGLFPLTPILLPALVGLVLLALARRTAAKAAPRAAVAIVLLTFAATATLSNWRGGWTIGPRYLATLVPLVAWAAQRAMDAAHRRWPRSTEAFAIGSLAASIVASGVPSALYPHLPEAITRPLPQLFWPMLQGGYAPHNAGHLLGLRGVTSLLPLAGVVTLAFGAVALGASWPRLAMPWQQKLRLTSPQWTRRLLGGGLVAAVLLAPLLATPGAGGGGSHGAGDAGADAARRAERAERAADEAVAFVLDHFTPPPTPSPEQRPAQRTPTRPRRPDAPSR